MSTLDTTDNGGVPAFLDRRPLVGTYTMLHTFKNICEHQAYRRYVKKDQKYVETPEMIWGTQVHEAFEKRVSKGKVLPDNMRQWEHFAQPFDKFNVLCEQKLGMTAEAKPCGFFDSNVYFRGKADNIVIQENKALLSDYKTGSSKFEDPFELATGALLVKVHHPHVTKVVGRYLWLKENRAGQMHDLSDFKGTWGEMRRLMQLIEQKRHVGDWEKKKSGLCGWCSVEDCENWYSRK